MTVLPRSLTVLRDRAQDLHDDGGGLMSFETQLDDNIGRGEVVALVVDVGQTAQDLVALVRLADAQADGAKKVAHAQADVVKSFFDHSHGELERLRQAQLRSRQ